MMKQTKALRTLVRSPLKTALTLPLLAATAFLFLYPPRPASNRVGRGGADCPQCAPGGSRRRARGVAPRSPAKRAHGVRGDVGHPPDPS